MNRKLTIQYKKDMARLLRTTAKQIENNYRGCCGAMDQARFITGLSYDLLYETDRTFTRLFKKDAKKLGTQQNAYYFEGFDSDGEPEPFLSEEVKSRRVLGLLLCAYLIETGEWS